jgi:GxxExxY protein
MHTELTYKINGCLFQVHNSLKKIWNENIYETACQLELQAQGLQAECQKKFDVFYFEQRVGHYKIDILVENTVIVELKAVQEVLPIHKAQLISYLKGYNKPVGILANFGERSLYHRTFENKFDQKNALKDTYDFAKVQIKEKNKIKDLLDIANRILVTLGVGYLAQVYRRAFYYELKLSKIDFEVMKEMNANYLDQYVGSKEVNFFIVGDLLLSVVAVQELNREILSEFFGQMKYLKCKRGLIFNFNALHLDYRYFDN